MNKKLIEYIRENDQCDYADIYDYFKDLSQCDDSLKAEYLIELLLYILQEEQKEYSDTQFRSIDHINIKKGSEGRITPPNPSNSFSELPHHYFR